MAEARKPENRADLSDILRILRRRKFIILITVGVGFFVGWFVVQSKEPVFESKASVEIKEEVTFQQLFTRYSTARGKIATESTIVTSFPVLAMVAKRLGDVPLDKTEDEIVLDANYQGRVRQLQNSVRAAPQENTNIIDIYSLAGTPNRARDLAQAVAEEYRTYSRNTAEARNNEADWFVKEQRGVLVDSLNKVEKDLIEFKEKHNILDLPAETQLYVGNFTKLMEQRNRIEVSVADIDQFMERLRSAAGAEGSFSPFSPEDVGESFTSMYKTYTDILREEKSMGVSLTLEHPAMTDLGVRRKALEQDLLRQSEEVRKRWEKQLNDVYKQIVELDQQHRTALHHQIELGRMDRELVIVQNILASLEEKYQEVKLQNSIRADNVRIVQPAMLPVDPLVRKSWGALLAVVVLGLVLGVGLAFVQESLDFSLVTIEEVEKYLGLPVLGVIPHYEPMEMERDMSPAVREAAQGLGHEVHRLVTHLQPKSVVAESYRALKMHLWKTGEGGRVFTATSAMPQEGKSTTMMNLAICFAQSGLKTLLIEGNTRRPVYKNVLKFPPKPGLVELVHGTTQLQDVLRDVTDLMLSELSLDFLKLTPGLENLSVIPAGETPLNPPDVLNSFVRSHLIEQFRKTFDIVLIDCPPVLPVSDATIVAPATDGVILVYRWGKTGRQLVRRGVEAIEKVGGKVLGVVLNDVDFKIGGLYPAYRYRMGRGTYTYGYPQKSERFGSSIAAQFKKLKGRAQAARERLNLRS